MEVPVSQVSDLRVSLSVSTTGEFADALVKAQSDAFVKQGSKVLSARHFQCGRHLIGKRRLAGAQSILETQECEGDAGYFKPPSNWRRLNLRSELMKNNHPQLRFLTKNTVFGSASAFSVDATHQTVMAYEQELPKGVVIHSRVDGKDYYSPTEAEKKVGLPGRMLTFILVNTNECTVSCFSGLDEKGAVEAGYSGGVFLSFEHKRLLPLFSKQSVSRRAFRHYENAELLAIIQASPANAQSGSSIVLWSDVLGGLVQTKESVDVMLFEYSALELKAFLRNVGPAISFLILILAQLFCAGIAEEMGYDSPRMVTFSAAVLAYGICGYYRIAVFAGYGGVFRLLGMVYIFIYGSAQEPSPFELTMALAAVLARGVSVSAFGSSGFLVLLAEFVSSLCLALCGLIATEGQLSLHVTVLLSLFSGALTSQPGLLISRTRDALNGESDLKTLFDVLSVSYTPDDSGDLDLDAAVQSMWLGFCRVLRYLMLVGAVLSLISEPLLAMAGGEVLRCYGAPAAGEHCPC